MKINNPTIRTITGTVVNDGQKRADKPAEAGASSAQGVNISEFARKLQSIEGNLAGGAVVNTAKVTEIKQAISDGHFKVNPEVVADRLLETVRELIQSAQTAR